MSYFKLQPSGAGTAQRTDANAPPQLVPPKPVFAGPDVTPLVAKGAIKTAARVNLDRDAKVVDVETAKKIYDAPHSNVGTVGDKNVFLGSYPRNGDDPIDPSSSRHFFINATDTGRAGQLYEGTNIPKLYVPKHDSASDPKGFTFMPAKAAWVP